MTSKVSVFCKAALYTVAGRGKLHTVDKVEERTDYQKCSDKWEHVTFAYRAKPDYDRAAVNDTDGKWENDWIAFFQYTPVPGGPPLNGSAVKDLSLATCSSIQKNINTQQNSKRIDWGPYGDNRTWNEVDRMWVPRVPVIFFEKDRGNSKKASSVAAEERLVMPWPRKPASAAATDNTDANNQAVSNLMEEYTEKIARVCKRQWAQPPPPPPPQPPPLAYLDECARLRDECARLRAHSDGLGRDCKRQRAHSEVQARECKQLREESSKLKKALEKATYQSQKYAVDMCNATDRLRQSEHAATRLRNALQAVGGPAALDALNEDVTVID